MKEREKIHRKIHKPRMTKRYESPRVYFVCLYECTAFSDISKVNSLFSCFWQTTQELKEPKKKKKKSVYSVPTEWEAISDPTYSSWMPPEGNLNENSLQ